MSLNDPRWGRDSDESKEDARSSGESESKDEDRRDSRADDTGSSDDKRSGGRRSSDSGDELDNLWADFTDMMKKFGFPAKDEGKDRRSELKSRDDFSFDDERDAEPPRSEPRREQRNPIDEEKAREAVQQFSRIFFGEKKKAGSASVPPKRGKGGFLGVGIVPAALVAVWAASGFYIVPEGQTGVVTTFGRYAESTMPGFHWHIPMPIQSVQLVDVSSVRTAEIGSRNSPNRLSEALMLTDDENIVDVQFTVQYRIKPEIGAKDFLFNTRAPDASVVQAAESAMREVVGRRTMDSILFESKAEIAELVKTAMQSMLDKYGTGIEVMSVAIQNAQPPQQVQAAFNDAVKAGQDRERAINLGEAYMNAVLPKAQGTASRMKEEAEGYKARVIETARGDADRFRAVYEEYKKAPQVTRDRLYIDAAREVFTSSSKVYVDSKGSGNLLYLPLDKIVGQTKESAAKQAAEAVEQYQTPPVKTPESGDFTSNTASARYQTESDFRDLRSRIRQ